MKTEEKRKKRVCLVLRYGTKPISRGLLGSLFVFIIPLLFDFARWNDVQNNQFTLLQSAENGRFNELVIDIALQL